MGEVSREVEALVVKHGADAWIGDAMVKLMTTHPDLPCTTDPSIEAHLIGSNTGICIFLSTSFYFIREIELHAPYTVPPLSLIWTP